MDRDIKAGQVAESPQLDTSLMPVFQEYRRENESWAPDFDLWSYIRLRADADLAAAFTKLFWPDFVEVDGCVILKIHYSPDNFQEWCERYPGDRRAIEGGINHVHLWDLFQRPPGDEQFPDRLYEYLADTLVFGWKQALRAAYPGKEFVFTLRHGYGPEISFHQTTSEGKG